ncbi:MAG: hypothetical protein ACE5FL_11875 [Myxococcota bacterium]
MIFRYIPMVCILSLLLAPLAAHAQEDPGEPAAGEHAGWSLSGGIGFTADPDSFLTQFAAPYDFGNGLSLGPQLQIGISDRRTLVESALDLRYSFDLFSREGEEPSAFRPFVNAGLGFAYLERERNNRSDRDDVEALIEAGMGIGYAINESVSLESAMQLHFLPDELLGERFYFTWQLVGARYRF